MKIDKKLNLVAQVETANGIAHIHSSPISRMVFEMHAKVMAKAFSYIYGELGSLSGSRISYFVLRDIAKEMGVWEGLDGVEHSLVNEIRRLTNVFVQRPDGGGWQLLPYDSNQAREVLDEDDYSEIDGMLVFFTLASSLHRKSELKGHLIAAGNFWGFAPSSLNATGFQLFLETLPTATDLPIENSLPEVRVIAPSSIPS